MIGWRCLVAYNSGRFTGFAYAGAETRVCFVKTTINNVQILKAATGPAIAEFSYDSIEVVDDNPTVLCLITRGYRAGVYYFDTYEVGMDVRTEPPFTDGLLFSAR